MAGRTRHIVVSYSEPPVDALWLDPYGGIVRIHTPKGWLPLQGPLFIALNGKVDALASRVASDERDIAANAEGVASLAESKQDRLEAGRNITIEGDVISASGEADMEEMTAERVQEIWDAEQ